MPSTSFIPAIAGPTAVGKTAVSLLLAETHPIEIISVDSMQVYRQLDIGTAKPSTEERARVPHHLIDVASPAEKYDLARYLKDATAAVDAIRRRGNIPVFVGGTGLYLKSLMTGIFAIPSSDPAMRATLNARVLDEGTQKLHEELAAIDPVAAQRISPNDAIRIVRALEVFQSTGKTITHWHSHPETPQTPVYALRLVVLHLPREQLNARIHQRVQLMLDAGWVEEVRALLAQGVRSDAHCFKALGYREIARRIENNESLEGLVEAIAKETRQFAKRQMTWFRAMKDAQWAETANATPQQVASQVERALFG